MSYSEALSLVRYQTRTAAAFSNLATPPIGDQFKPRGTLLTGWWRIGVSGVQVAQVLVEE